MTLDEAIRIAEEQADLLEESAKGCDLTDKVEQEIACKSGKCAEEHRQLAEWLKELKKSRIMLKSAANILTKFLPCDDDYCSECFMIGKYCEYDDCFKWKFRSEAEELLKQ